MLLKNEQTKTKLPSLVAGGWAGDNDWAQAGESLVKTKATTNKMPLKGILQATTAILIKEKKGEACNGKLVKEGMSSLSLSLSATSLKNWKSWEEKVRRGVAERDIIRI